MGHWDRQKSDKKMSDEVRMINSPMIMFLPCTHEAAETNSVAADSLVIQLAIHKKVHGVSIDSNGKGAGRLTAATILLDDLKLHTLIINIGVAAHAGNQSAYWGSLIHRIHFLIIIHIPRWWDTSSRSNGNGHSNCAVKGGSAFVFSHDCPRV